MLNFVLIAGCLGLGALLRSTGKFPESTATWLNKWVIYVALPAAILRYIPGLSIEAATLLPALMPWIVFIIGAIIIIVAAKRFEWKNESLGALLMTASLGNTSFVGFPILQALFGEDALQTGIIIDQAGSFLTVSTLGIIAASRYSSQNTSAREILKRIVTFPPFIVLVFAFLIRDVAYPAWVERILEPVAWSLGPVALVSVGFQLRVNRSLLERYKAPLMLGLGYKLILAPVLIALLYGYIFGVRGELFQITVVEAAMPPMITAAIIANEYGLDRELTSLMVGLGIPISLLTLGLWALAVG